MGGWGKPAVDEYGRPMYGDVCGERPGCGRYDPRFDFDGHEKKLWGELRKPGSKVTVAVRAGEESDGTEERGEHGPEAEPLKGAAQAPANDAQKSTSLQEKEHAKQGGLGGGLGLRELGGGGVLQAHLLREHLALDGELDPLALDGVTLVARLAQRGHGSVVATLVPGNKNHLGSQHEHEDTVLAAHGGALRHGVAKVCYAPHEVDDIAARLARPLRWQLGV
ncbi:hypothetical protein FGB62_12g425 [Gracilaria domingensis]|nr:hypothetical protein FGB62_12g425 [Gracilaria domingensis]